MSEPGTAPWRRAEASRLIAFGRAAALPDGGFGWLGRQRRNRRDAALPAVHQRAHDLRVRARAPGRGGRRGFPGGIRTRRPRPPLRRRARTAAGFPPRPIRARHRLRQDELRSRPRPAGGRQRGGRRDSRCRCRLRGRRGRHRTALLVRRRRLRAGELERRLHRTRAVPRRQQQHALGGGLPRRGRRHRRPRLARPGRLHRHPPDRRSRPGQRLADTRALRRRTGGRCRTTTSIAATTSSGRTAPPPATPSNGPGCC